MCILYWLVELKPIGVVHDYYMMPFLLPLYLLVGIGMDQLNKWHPKAKIFLVLLIFFSALYTQKISQIKWSIEKSSLNADVFKYSEELKSAVPQNEHCIILNDHSSYIFSYRIDKMGHVFNEYLPISWVHDMIENYGVRYMYSDSQTLNESEEFKKYIDHTIMTKGSVKVYKLKLQD